MNADDVPDEFSAEENAAILRLVRGLAWGDLVEDIATCSRILMFWVIRRPRHE